MSFGHRWWKKKSENYAIIKWMNENAINEWNFKIWCLTQWNYIKKKNLLKQNYLFHTNLQFQKIHKNFTICVTRMQYKDQTHMPPANLFPQPPHSGWGNTAQYTLANSNLHQPF